MSETKERPSAAPPLFGAPGAERMWGLIDDAMADVLQGSTPQVGDELVIEEWSASYTAMWRDADRWIDEIAEIETDDIDDCGQAYDAIRADGILKVLVGQACARVQDILNDHHREAGEHIATITCTFDGHQWRQSWQPTKAYLDGGRADA